MPLIQGMSDGILLDFRAAIWIRQKILPRLELSRGCFMSGDNLTICLFLVGTGIAIGLTAMSTAGWRHPVLIGGLFLLAGACFISGFAWPWIKDASPVVTQSVTQVATNPVSWFLVLILGVASAHLPSKRASVISESDQSFGARAFRRAPDSPLPAPASAAQT
ncbi:MAG: hypothetical protein WA831_03285, partial [Methylovirgula sp.]